MKSNPMKTNPVQECVDQTRQTLPQRLESLGKELTLARGVWERLEERLQCMISTPQQPAIDGNRADPNVGTLMCTVDRLIDDCESLTRRIQQVAETIDLP